jgi:hypothetical protein
MFFEHHIAHGKQEGIARLQRGRACTSGRGRGEMVFGHASPLIPFRDGGLFAAEAPRKEGLAQAQHPGTWVTSQLTCFRG